MSKAALGIFSKILAVSAERCLWVRKKGCAAHEGWAWGLGAASSVGESLGAKPGDRVGTAGNPATRGSDFGNESIR